MIAFRNDNTVRSAESTKSYFIRLLLCLSFISVLPSIQLLHAFQAVRSDRGVTAEDSGKSSSSTESEDPQNTKSTTSRTDGDVIYLPNKDGVLIAVPYNSKYEEYIDWISNQDASPIEKPYTISSVVIDGRSFRSSAGKEYIAANIEVRFTLHQDGWTQIRLEMSELIVGENISHVGAGEFLFDRRDAAQGMIWWAKGQGKHKIRLKGYIPVRRDITTRRLSLQVPKTLVNELKIVIPENRIELVSASETGIQSVSQSGADSIIEMKGDIERFDISWRLVAKATGKQNSIESQATFLLSESNESLNLTVNQRLASLQGAIRSIDVRLPGSFEFMDVTCDDLESYRLDQQRQSVKLTLRKPTIGPIDLNWRFRTLVDADNSKITIDGLDVQGTNLETGEILISSSGERQFLPVELDSETVVKKRLDSRTTLGSYSSGFRFLKQPFRLDLSPVVMQPEYTLRPEYFLAVNGGRLELDMRVKVQMMQGQLDELHVNWPDVEMGEWDIDPFLMSASGGTWNKIDNQHFVIQFDKPISGQQTIALKAVREKPSDKSSYGIGLPEFKNSASYPALVAIGDRLNSQTSMIDTEDAVLDVGEEEGLERFAWITNRDLYRLQFFEIRPDRDKSVLTLKTNVYAQEVGVTTFVETRIQDKSIIVTQRLDLNVEKEELSELRLRIPESTNTQFRLNGDLQTELNSTLFKVENQRVADLRFRPSVLGKKQLVIVYRVPLPETSLSVNLPLATFVGHEFSEVHFRVDQKLEDQFVAVVDNAADTPWDVRLSQDGEQSFVRQGDADTIPLQIRSKRNSKLVVLKENRLSITSKLTRAHHCYSTVEGILLRPLDQLIIDLPDDAKSVTFTIPDKGEIPIRTISESENRIRIDMDSVSISYPLRFQLRYQQAAPKSGVLGYHLNSPAPRIFAAGNVDIRWQFDFPSGEHLLSSSDGLHPQFRWAWNWFGWRRVNFGEIRSENLYQSNEDQSGASYRFLVLSLDSSTHSIRTIRQSTLLLFGAGTGLFLGLLIVQSVSLIGGTRTTCMLIPLFLLAMLFDQSTVFIQPIGLGVLLSVVAFAINRRRHAYRRRTKISAVAYSQPSDQNDPSHHSIWRPSESLEPAARSDSTQSHAVAVADQKAEASSQLEKSVSR